MTDLAPSTGATGAALVAIATALVGQRYGPLATVIFAALVGALISLGEVVTNGRLDGLKYVGRYVLMAVAIAFGLSQLVERYTHIPAVEVLALVAFCIGWVGNRWRDVLAVILNGFKSIVNQRTGNSPAGKGNDPS